MTPSKSGSRTEERGRGSPAPAARSAPRVRAAFCHSQSAAHLPGCSQSQSVACAAGRSRSPVRWGDLFRAVAQRPARIRWPIRFYPPGVRSAPPATAGSRVPAARSAFALRGEPPRLWLSSLLLSRSSPPCLAHNALRWQSARCRWPDPLAPSALAPWGGALPPRPEAPPVPQHGGQGRKGGLALRAGACSPARSGLP